MKCCHIQAAPSQIITFNAEHAGYGGGNHRNMGEGRQILVEDVVILLWCQNEKKNGQISKKSSC